MAALVRQLQTTQQEFLLIPPEEAGQRTAKEVEMNRRKGEIEKLEKHTNALREANTADVFSEFCVAIGLNDPLIV